MTTETKVVNEFVRDMRRHPDKYVGWVGDRLRHAIHLALTRDDLGGGFYFGPRSRRERDYMAERLERRIRKKLGQPFRRKKRGPLRRRAAGKNEVTRRAGPAL